QCPPRVEQTHALEQHVQRDDHRDGRQHALRDEPERDVAVADTPPPEPAADRLGEDQEYAEGGYNHDLPWRAKANRDRGGEQAAREEADQRDPRPVMEAP